MSSSFGFLCYDVSNRVFGLWKHYLTYFPAFSFVMYSFAVRGMVECVQMNKVYVIAFLVAFHIGVFLGTCMYYMCTLLDATAIQYLTRSIFSTLLFFSLTYVWGKPYTCVVAQYNNFYANVQFLIINCVTIVLAVRMHESETEYSRDRSDGYEEIRSENGRDNDSNRYREIQTDDNTSVRTQGFGFTVSDFNEFYTDV